MVFVCFEVVLCFLRFCWILFGVEHKSTHLSFRPQVQRLQRREEVTFSMFFFWRGCQGSLNGTHIGRIKQYKCKVMLSDLPVIRCIVWVGNTMTPGWCWLVDGVAWFLLVAPHKSGSKANRSCRENHNDAMMTRRRLHANTGSCRTRTIFNLRMELRNEQLYIYMLTTKTAPGTVGKTWRCGHYERLLGWFNDHLL